MGIKKKTTKKKKKKNLYFRIKKALKKKKKNCLKILKKYKKSLIKKINKIKTNTKKLRLFDLQIERELKNESAKRQEEINYRDSVLNKEIVETNKRIFFKFSVILITVAFLAGIVMLVFNRESNNNELNTITFDQYKELYSSEELKYVYITENNCTYCELLDPYILKLEEDYGIIVQSLNIGNLSETELLDLSNSNSVFEEGWTAPILLSIKEGRELSHVKGYKEYSVLKRFVEYSINPSDNNSFIKINVDEYLELLNNEESTLIYIGSPNSSGCETFAPLLEEVSIERDFSVYYLNTNSLDKANEWNKLTNSNKIFQDIWFVPTILIVKDSKISSYKMETMDKEDLINFLKKNNL